MIPPKKNQIIKICNRLNESLNFYKFLSRGNHHEIYLLKTKSRKSYIIKIENNMQFKNIKKEYYFIKKVGSSFAPQIYFFDSSKKILSNDYLVEEFIPSKPFNKKPNKKFLKSMANWYKRLHSYSFKNKKSVYLCPLFKKYKNNLSKNINYLDKEVLISIKYTFAICDKLFFKYNKIFSNRKEFPLIQGDASITNVFYNNGKVRLIDWEFADYNLKEYDLVSFCYSYDLSPPQINFF